jgi:3-isopropylmalate/(R)-2-methylmalate dehydratase small subunit
MEGFTSVTSRTVVLPASDVDTDQIIPARFLRTTSKEGLGQQLFADWRYLPDGTPNPDFALNRPEAAGARVLVAGDNFGCGSSREHAPWALTDFGILAVVSTGSRHCFPGTR